MGGGDGMNMRARLQSFAEYSGRHVSQAAAHTLKTRKAVDVAYIQEKRSQQTFQAINWQPNPIAIFNNGNLQQQSSSSSGGSSGGNVMAAT